MSDKRENGLVGLYIIFLGVMAHAGVMSSRSQRSQYVHDRLRATQTVPATVPATVIEALVQAQRFAVAKLERPATASFGNVFAADYQLAKDVVTDRGNGKYEVRAWVDSENFLGVKHRTYFTCHLTHFASGKWVCTSLSLRER